MADMEPAVRRGQGQLGCTEGFVHSGGAYSGFVVCVCARASGLFCKAPFYKLLPYLKVSASFSHKIINIIFPYHSIIMMVFHIIVLYFFQEIFL